MTPTDIAARIEEWENCAIIQTAEAEVEFERLGNPLNRDVFLLSKRILTLCEALKNELEIKEQIRRIAKFGLMKSNCPYCGEIVAHIFRTKEETKPNLEESEK